MSADFLKISDLKKDFPLEDGFALRRSSKVIHALQGVSLEVQKGQTLGIVGESGCGKSTLARCVARLVEPTSGQIFFQNQDISDWDGERLRSLRRKIQIVFQNPFSSLNPRMKIGETLEEPLVIHDLHNSRKDRLDRVDQLLETVGLRPGMKDRYPHEFSGGQRQRIGIARALAVEPELLICDEPVSALDVSVQAQVINLLMDLQQKLGLTYLFIAHDLKVVEHVSSQVAVMYLGKVVETAATRELFRQPQHPYTQALLSAIPKLASRNSTSQRILLTGEVPSAQKPPSGCQFHPRCPMAIDECRQRTPSLEEKRTRHAASCFRI